MEDQPVAFVRSIREGAKRRVILGLLLAATGCVRHPAMQSADETTPAAQPPPFERPADASGISPTAAFLPASIASIPAGTALMVRLQTSLSSASCHAGDFFQAVLDEPIVIQGETIAARGEQITGEVSAVSASIPHSSPGYLRLTLTAISLSGKMVTLQTSSVFGKGGPVAKWNPAGTGTMIGTSMETHNPPPVPSPRSQDVEFSSERPLTFRLAQPVSLSASSRS
jgi:hypothetical protein